MSDATAARPKTARHSPPEELNAAAPDTSPGLFLAAPPGLERTLADEAAAIGLRDIRVEKGGVSASGGIDEAMRANLHLRCAGQVLMRLASFRALHFAQLDKRTRKLDWSQWLTPDVPVRVDAVCRQSKIYHHRAARERIVGAITDLVGAPIADDAPLRVTLRIDDDLATLSLDTSGEPLHRRGFKQAIGKAPLRETLAAAFLRQMNYDGTMPVIDPMCGSGTFVLEAAEIALGLAPGRGRDFAFEHMAGFDAERWAALKTAAEPQGGATEIHLQGFDRDDGAIRMSTDNAARAGLSEICSFARQPIAALTRPPGPPGLVMINPPYGARIGNRKLLFALYGSLGTVLRSQFSGWRVGIVTSDIGLAKATELPFLPMGPSIAHGGLMVRFFQTAPLP